jgi:ankyrin repeat protein
VIFPWFGSYTHVAHQGHLPPGLLQDGATPLHLASMKGRLEVVGMLLGPGAANVGATDNVRFTCGWVHRVVLFGRVSLEGSKKKQNCQLSPMFFSMHDQLGALCNVTPGCNSPSKCRTSNRACALRTNAGEQKGPWVQGCAWVYD